MNLIILFYILSCMVMFTDNKKACLEIWCDLYRDDEEGDGEGDDDDPLSRRRKKKK